MSGCSKDSRIGTRVPWLFIGLVLAACDFDDPDSKGRSLSRQGGGNAPATPSAGSVSIDTDTQIEPTIDENAADAGDAGSATPMASLMESTDEPTGASAISLVSLCPEDMIEVQGAYCADVMHRCIKGGKSHTWEPSDEPQPFYCDVYQTGFAKCYGKRTDKHFCIDEFEYPNQLGAIPMVMVTWYEAQRLCNVQGKRLCGDDEWTLACEGPEMMPYPYGWARDKTACNIDHPWMEPNDSLLANKSAPPAEILAEIERLSKRVPSGSMPGCKSPYGVMDMCGNVDEWAVNVTYRGKPYQSVFKGGHWVRGARNRCRPVTTSHDESTAYYAEGFRCCADVEAPREH